VEEDLRRPLTQRLGPRQWRDLDIVLALTLAGVNIGVTATDAAPTPAGTGWDVVRYVATGVACLALPARRRFPIATLAVVTTGAVFVFALNAHSGAIVAAAFATYSVACVAPRRISLTALGCTVAALVAGAAASSGQQMLGELIGGPALAGLGWVAGENTRGRQEYAAAQAEQAVERERQREARLHQTAADERLRIARELHDVVAHSMSVIAVRSGVARVVMDRQPDEARQALAIIESTSRAALQEMRLIVGVLREEKEAAVSSLAPAPGLVDLPNLLNRIAEAGVAVNVEVHGKERPLPAGVDLSAYRIVQEALTNVVRHAGPTKADVRMDYGPKDLTIEVIDEGPRQHPWPPAPTEPGAGHGLVGMRERVGLFGGELQSGPRDRGFRVWARLPGLEPTT
jgi:signal transduction histidine kinase